jgi:hypothetical protein
MAEIWLWMILCPSVEDLGQGCGLPAPCGQIPLQDEYKNDIALSCEVGDILGDNSSVLCPGGRCYLSVLGAAEADLGDVDCVMAVCVT